MFRIVLNILFAISVTGLISCSSVVRYSSENVYENEVKINEDTAVGAFTQTGYASYYADKFEGRLTASGEVFSQKKFTAAHRTLPFGTKLKVTNLENGKTVVVVVNDRGPFVDDRIIDLSKAAAESIGMTGSGVVKVKIEKITN